MKRKIFLLFVCGILLTSVKAQKLFENWAVGINAGTYGGGVQVATSLSPNFKLRAGYDHLSFKYDEAIGFDAPADNAPEGASDLSGELSGAKLIFPNFKALVDYYPMKNGIFCLTAGFYLGSNKISANGMIRDYKEKTMEYGGKPRFQFEDVAIEPNDDGSFGADLKLGRTIKPYIGIGLGKTIAKKRVGFKFELGLVNQGSWKVESPNVNGESLNSKAADLDLPVSKSVLDWWPMINFALSYRIK